MKRIEAYRCEYCGKIYLTPHGCKRHEDRGCCQRPERRPLCYSCKHYHQELVEKENIIYYTGYATPWGEEENMKKFDVNRCAHPDNECKLFNNFKLSAEMQTALSEADFVAMPSMSIGGCKFYAPIPEHPYAVTQENTDNNSMLYDKESI